MGKFFAHDEDREDFTVTVILVIVISLLIGIAKFPKEEPTKIPDEYNDKNVRWVMNNE